MLILTIAREDDDPLIMRGREKDNYQVKNIGYVRNRNYKFENTTIN